MTGGSKITARRVALEPVPSELDRLQREIAATDTEIDNLVYELHGFTNEERQIIGGG